MNENDHQVVSTDSVCIMIEDIYKCMSSNRLHVRMPVPPGYSGPTICMYFVDEEDTCPTEISPRSTKSSHRRSSKQYNTGAADISASVVSRARFISNAMANQSMVNLAEIMDKPTPSSMASVIEEIESVALDYTPRESRVTSPVQSRVCVSDTDGNATDSDSMDDMEEDFAPPVRAATYPPNINVENNRIQPYIIGGPAGRFGRY